jgi:hypothetical protein
MCMETKNKVIFLFYVDFFVCQILRRKVYCNVLATWIIKRKYFLSFFDHYVQKTSSPSSDQRLIFGAWMGCIFRSGIGSKNLA